MMEHHGHRDSPQLQMTELSFQLQTNLDKSEKISERERGMEGWQKGVREGVRGGIEGGQEGKVKEGGREGNKDYLLVTPPTLKCTTE